MKKVAEYTAEENKRLKKKMVDMLAGSAIFVLFANLLIETNAFNGYIPESASHNFVAFALGLTLAVLGLNIMYLVGIFDRISEWKMNRRESKR